MRLRGDGELMLAFLGGLACGVVLTVVCARPVAERMAAWGDPEE